MRLFIFADSHYGRAEIKNKNRFPRLSLEKLKSLEDEILTCDAIVCLGDLTDDGERRECRVCLEEISSYLRGLSKDTYILMGNHDCINFSEGQFYSWGGFENKAPFCLSCGESTLLFFDTNYLSNKSRYLYSNVDWTDSILPTDQLALIEEALEGDSERIYLFMHQCAAPDAEVRHRIKNSEELHSLLKASKKSITVIQGHYHYGADSVIDGIKYITLPALCVNDTRPYMILDTDSK